MSLTAADLRIGRSRRNPLRRNPLRRIWPGLVVAVIVFGGWELYVRTTGTTSLVLPAPSAILQRIFAQASYLAHDALTTLGEAALGFLLALMISIVLAALMVHLPLLDRAIEPVQIAIRCTPVVAVAPALMLSMGFGPGPKVLMAALITFAPFLVNAVTGFRSIDAETLEVLRSVNASKLDIFWHLRIPHALPYLFSAARVCVSLSLMGAVVAEWTGSSQGLGYSIIAAQKDLDTTTVWACILVLAATGVVLTSAVRLLESKMLRTMTDEGTELQ